MRTTVGQAKAEARRFLRAGDLTRALHVYDRLLAAAPRDHEARLGIADLLARAGRDAQAAGGYETVAAHDIRAGHPLAAMVACAALERLGRPAHELRGERAGRYTASSVPAR